jgi:hypothetical protein
VGHLFQNRYNSIVVAADPSLRALVRYLHLNPLRAKVVPALRALDRYPWTGHCALVGPVPRPWQGTAPILAQFGPTRRRAVSAYRTFVAAGVARVCQAVGIPPAALTGGGRRPAVSRARAGIAYLWLEVLGHPGRPLAPVLGVHPAVVYPAARRGARAAATWQALLRENRYTT